MARPTTVKTLQIDVLQGPVENGKIMHVFGSYGHSLKFEQGFSKLGLVFVRQISLAFSQSGL